MRAHPLRFVLIPALALGLAACTSPNPQPTRTPGPTGSGPTSGPLPTGSIGIGNRWLVCSVPGRQRIERFGSLDGMVCIETYARKTHEQTGFA